MWYKHSMILSMIVFTAGCAKEFPATPFTADELATQALLERNTDFDSRLELARLHFTHNYIEEADALLTSLVKEEPTSMEAKAWYGANSCKKAGRTAPWLLGMEKLYLVWNCLREVEDALTGDPTSFTVQMVHMNTGAEVDMFGSMQRAVDVRDRVEKRIEAKPESYTVSAQSAFLETSAYIEELRGNRSRAAEYLKRIISLDADAGSSARAKAKLLKLGSNLN